MNKTALLLPTLLYLATPFSLLAETAPPPEASVDGAYSRLIQTIHCPSDGSTYGEFQDFGYWSGGEWCGQQGSAGYWVWVNPNWYIWGAYADESGSGQTTTGGDSKPVIYNDGSGGSYVGGKRCSYVNAGGMTMKMCD